MKKLWQSGRVKDYYSELTEIVRWYIEKRFHVQALEMTTDEIISGLKTAYFVDENIHRLKQTLILADMVKFAKEQPLPADNDISIQRIEEFIKTTKPEPELEEKTELTTENKEN
jgi:hypothetical protein